MTPQPSVASGYVLVPREPTEAMIDAGMQELPSEWNTGDDFTRDDARDAWAAMLAAAPTPPGGEVVFDPALQDSIPSWCIGNIVAVAAWMKAQGHGSWNIGGIGPVTAPPAADASKLRLVLDLLDNVTASTDTEADFLGQAENTLNAILDAQQAEGGGRGE